MVFVDSNVIVDVITADPCWQKWSKEQLRRTQDQGVRPPSEAEWPAW
jgi:predicted nucleic acid-binding protein